MLSPQEFATLMLVKDVPDPLKLDRTELNTLLEHQLVTLERLASGDGDLLLQAVARMH
ncbi:hypothetical protein [Pararobbsia alpina]|uniref:Uncharacterized protein n=1 Tax=Pararobbsia alpina TaxID=621374 RepID=A0A6S7DGB6_9BURK|nr:hypothetical protein [Pararobbsia alpina]CAB3805003.1 hypothetical protein LMG28138_05617 [Pararobbsia alpina]